MAERTTIDQRLPLILLIDDSPIFLAIIGSSVSDWGFEVTEASSGADALQILEDQPVDLIVSDLAMPEIDGLQLLPKLQEKAPDVPVIMLSSAAQIDKVLEAIHLGAFDYVVKDERLGPLRAAINRALDHTRLLRENHQLLTELQAMLAQERNRKELLEQMVADRTRDLVSANRETEQILQNIRQAILTVKPDLTIGQHYSRYAETLFGRSGLAEQPFPDILLPEAVRMRRELSDWLKLVFHSPSLNWETARRSIQSEYSYIRPDKERRDLLLDFEPIHEEGRISRLMVIAQDLTEKRALERDLESKQQEIEENIDHLAEIAQLDPEIYEAFFEEAIEIIDNAEKMLAALYHDSSAPELAAKLFQDMHTLKGNAMSFRLVRVAAKAHWVEEAFSTLRASEGKVREATVRETEERVRELRAFLDRIQNMARRVLRVGQANKDRGQVRSQKRSTLVTVEQSKLTALLDWVSQSSSELVTPEGCEQLLAMVQALSLVPMSKLYGRFPKMVGDLAEDLGKKVNDVVLEGGELELDDRTLGHLGNAMVHLLRNALDHGIEPPDQRVAAGKPEHGTITVRSRYTAEHLRVEVSDDGSGIDTAPVLERAREQGLVAARLPGGNDLSDSQASLEVLFLPGFSTASVVTKVSGRGVGMGSVRDAIAQLGGTLQIETVPARGTTFIIQIPNECISDQVDPGSLAPGPGTGISAGISRTGEKSKGDPRT